MSVWVRLGLVPRRLTRSDSSKPPSSALEELMFTPARPRRASATLCAGSLPTSSAVTPSMRASALRFTSMDLSRLGRLPLTPTVSSPSPELAAASCAYAGAACVASASDTAAAINVELLMLIPRFPFGFDADQYGATIVPIVGKRLACCVPLAYQMD